MRHARVLTAVQNAAQAPIDSGQAQVNFDCWLYALAHEAESETVAACRNGGKCISVESRERGRGGEGEEPCGGVYTEASS